MELKIDLLKRCETPISYIAIGGAYVVLAAFAAVMDKNTFLWLSFGGIGICFITIGLVFPLERLFTKSYISIDSELISLKASAYCKAQSVDWREIKSIDYKTHQIIIEKTDNTTKMLKLLKFSYPLKAEIKETIKSIAKDKNIQSAI